MEKMPGDIIIIQMCTVNEDHMIYGFWNKARQTDFL